MDVADTLVDKIFSWVELMEECSDKLNQQADEIEKTNKNVNVAKVVGSSVSVAGAGTATLAGVATLLTGGAALPFLAGAALAAGAASWLGLANNAVADVVNAAASGSTLKEAGDVVKKIEDLHEEIEELVEKLKKEAQKKGEHDGSCSDDRETELILRAMAKRVGLRVDDCVSLKEILEEHFHEAIKTAIWSALRERIQITAILIGQSVGGKLAAKLAAITAKITVRSLGRKTAAKAAKEAARSAGGKLAAKAAGRVCPEAAGVMETLHQLIVKLQMVGGVLGLAISIPELVDNCKNLDVCETGASKSLRENARAIGDESEDMKKDLHQIEKLFQRLARVKHCIQNTPKSNDDKKAVIEFAREFFKNKVIQQWLKKNSDGEILFILLNLFESVRKDIAKKEEEEEKKKKRKKKIIDITFVAHGAIDSGSMIPACCLLPPNIKDVVLYSPWNCYITADVAYGIATGDIEPEHRLFVCADPEECIFHNQHHQPRDLPGRWNLMREAGHQTIPDITVSPKKTPYDGAFDQFKVLEDTHGRPNTNRVVILYTLPGPDIPFYVITLALALVLFFTDYEATIHLAACLGEESEVDRSGYLQQQYAYTINNTAMTVKSGLFPVRDEELYRALKALFGETHSM